MLKSFYVLSIKDRKILKRLLKYKVNIENIAYLDDTILIKVDYLNYLKVIKYRKVFDISLIRIEGINKYKYLLRKYYLLLIFFIMGLLWITFLSNIIFSVKIMTNDQEIFKLLTNELNYHGLKKYQFVKSYEKKELIKKRIINDNKDMIEWLEITRSGSVYIINVERRIINKVVDKNDKRHVVSKKNAVIKEIRASLGTITKKINDYVNKGDIIVSGTIMKKDTIMNYVEAEARVYGETWYNVKVILPINYYDKVYTGKSKKRITLNFFNRKIKLFNFNDYQNEEVNEKIIIKHQLLPCSINYDTFYEIYENVDLLTNEKVWDIGFNIAKSKLLSTLPRDSEILSIKKLNLKVKDSKIELDVFLKVYENITDYQNIE